MRLLARLEDKRKSYALWYVSFRQSPEIKAQHSVSLADAWIAATALIEKAVLVHKDPEFETLDQEQICLPYRTTGLD